MSAISEVINACSQYAKVNTQEFVSCAEERSAELLGNATSNLSSTLMSQFDVQRYLEGAATNILRESASLLREEMMGAAQDISRELLPQMLKDNLPYIAAGIAGVFLLAWSAGYLSIGRYIKKQTKVEEKMLAALLDERRR